jgi:hypothetical protein
MHHLRNALAVLVFGVSVVTLTSVATSAAEPPQPDRSLARVNIGPTSIDWSPAVDYELLVLTVVGPGDLYIRQELKAGQSPSLGLFDQDGSPLPDGSYTYELRAIPRASKAQKEKPSEKFASQSGYFSIIRGAFAIPREEEALAGGSRSRLNIITAKDQVVSDDLIVIGNTCLGLDCVNGEVFQSSPLTLKENSTRITFQDTSTATGFATNDWRIGANDSVFGGANRFFIQDVDGNTIPLTLMAGAPNNSVYVDSAGRLGLGTATPAAQLEVSSGEVRFPPGAGAAGFTHFNFASDGKNYIRGTTIIADNAGSVGIGTASPSVRLDVKTSSNAAAVGRVQNTSATGYSGFEYLDNSGNVALYIGTDNASANTRFNSIQNYPIVLLTESVERMRITSAGNVGIGTTSPSSKLHVNGGDIRVSGGSFIDDGVTLNAPDYVFEPGYSLMPIEKLRDFVSREKRLPNVPSAREIKGQGLNLSQFQMRLLEKVEELTLYTLTQDERIGVQQERIAKLAEQNAKLLERLAALEKALPAAAIQQP